MLLLLWKRDWIVLFLIRKKLSRDKQFSTQINQTTEKVVILSPLQTSYNIDVVLVLIGHKKTRYFFAAFAAHSLPLLLRSPIRLHSSEDYRQKCNILVARVLVDWHGMTFSLLESSYKTKLVFTCGRCLFFQNVDISTRFLIDHHTLLNLSYVSNLTCLNLMRYSDQLASEFTLATSFTTLIH